MKQALYFKPNPDLSVSCLLCPVGCQIPAEGLGFCGARRNHNGVLYAEGYGLICSVAIDPIEKKPLYHFCPGTQILSLGSYGCNMRCPFCQNHRISMEKPRAEELSVETAVKLALKYKNDGSIGIAYTYNEPFINYEYMLETARLAKESGLKNVVITNGYVNEAPLREIVPYIHAMNIDLKGFGSRFYEKLKGGLEDVKRTIALSAETCHVEITTLVIPGENDSPSEMEQEAKWLSKINPGIPLHLSRFFPNYKMTDTPPTPVETLRELKVVAERYLRYVYLGNVR